MIYLGTPSSTLVKQAMVDGRLGQLVTARVNSRRRVRYATACGYDSVDGTHLAFGPDKNLPAVLGWMREANDQLSLF